MPRYKAPGTGRDWKPGQSGNPKGKPPFPKILKEAKKLTRNDFEMAVHKVRQMTLQEARDYMRDAKNVDVLEYAVIGQFIAAAKGNTAAFNFLCDRIIGPIKHELEISRPQETEETKKLYAELLALTHDSPNTIEVK